MKKQWISNLAFLFIVLGGILVRFAYSFNQSAILFNDNSLNAWEAAHFLDKFNLRTILKIPANLEIFSWSVLFKLFGPTTFSYNLLGIIQFVLLICFFYLFLKRIAGRSVSLLASLFLAFSPPIFTLSNLFFTGHSRGVMFSWLIFLLFYAVKQKPSIARYFALGFFSGMAIAIGKITPLLAFLCGFTLWADKRICWNKKIIFCLSILAITFAVFFNLNQPPEQFIYNSLGKGAFYNFSPEFFGKFIRVIKGSFYVSGSTITYFMHIGFQNKLPKAIYSAFFFISLPLWFYCNRRGLRKLLIFPMYLLLFFIVFSITRISDKILRYYIPAIPVYLYFVSDVLMGLTQSLKKYLRIIGTGSIILFFIFCLINNLHFFASPYRELIEVINFADSRKISSIYTDYNMQYALVFYSQGRITASSPISEIYRGTFLDNIVERAPDIAYLFENRQDGFEKYLKGHCIKYEARNFGSRVFYYDLSERFPPSKYETEVLKDYVIQ